MKFLVVLAFFAFVAVAWAAPAPGLIATNGLIGAPLGLSAWGSPVIGAPLGLTRTIAAPGLLAPGLITPGALGTTLLI